MRNLRTHCLILAGLVLLSGSGLLQAGQWRAAHPGGGGQVQDLVLDPSIPGRLYVLSDVEGLYRSDDYGESYQAIYHGIHNSMCFALAVDPSNPNRIYLGTIRGVLISDDAGGSWSPVTATTEHLNGSGDPTGLPVATITVDPVNPDNVYFANSWLIKDMLYVWNETGLVRAANGGNDVFKPGRIWVSRNAGESFDEITFESTSGYMNVYSIAVNPANPAHVYVAAHPGLYRSTNYGAQGSWEKIASPANTNHCRGIAVTPDGEWMYACFTTGDYGEDYYSKDNPVNNPDATLFMSKTATVNWYRRENTLNHGKSWGDKFYTEWWNPVIDPRSTAQQHHVLLGTMIGKNGLRQATFDVSGAAPDDPEWRLVLYKANENAQDAYSSKFLFDPGWDNYGIIGRHCAYTPTTWPSRKIWAVGDQSVYEGDPAAGGWPTSAAGWRERYSERVEQDGDFAAFKSRGWQSTVNWDIDGLGQYMVQAMSDNGIVESFDGGLSWTRDHRPTGLTNCQALHINRHLSPPIVLAAAGWGFGSAGSTDLHAMELNSGSPSDTWISSVNEGSIIPTCKYTDIATSPVDNSTVYVATVNGLFYHPDITQLIQKQGSFTQIASGNVDRIVPHPSDADRAIAIIDWKASLGEKVGGQWQWTQIDNTNASDVAAWKHGSQVYLAYIHKNNPKVFLSTDEGGNFSEIFVPNENIPYPPWYAWLNNERTWAQGKGLLGHEDKIYFGVFLPSPRKGLAFMRGTIASSGEVAFEDWTGTGRTRHDFTFVELTKLVDIDGAAHIASATHGCGTWLAPLDDATAAEGDRRRCGTGSLSVPRELRSRPETLLFDVCGRRLRMRTASHRSNLPRLIVHQSAGGRVEKIVLPSGR